MKSRFARYIPERKGFSDEEKERKEMGKKAAEALPSNTVFELRPIP